MIYVVDTCIMRELFHYKRSVVPEIWEGLEYLIENGEVVFAKESYSELEKQFVENNYPQQWIKAYKKYFLPANNEECIIVSEIYSYRNFENNVAKRNLLEGRPVADAFIVAKAKIIGGIVVTREKYTPNAARIPNICEKFGVECMYEEEFQLMLKNYKVRKEEAKND